MIFQSKHTETEVDELVSAICIFVVCVCVCLGNILYVLSE